MSSLGWNIIKAALIFAGLMAVWFFRMWGLAAYSGLLILLRFIKIHPQMRLRNDEDQRYLKYLV